MNQQHSLPKPHGQHSGPKSQGKGQESIHLIAPCFPRDTQSKMPLQKEQVTGTPPDPQDGTISEQGGPLAEPTQESFLGEGKEKRCWLKGSRTVLDVCPPPRAQGATLGQGKARRERLACFCSRSQGWVERARLRRRTLRFLSTHPSPPAPCTRSSAAPGPGPGHWVSHSHIPASIAHADATPRLWSVAAHSISGLAV